MRKNTRFGIRCRYWLGVLWLCLGCNLWAATPLRVGTAADYPPVVFLKGNEVVGMESDLARLLGAQLGQPLQFTVLPAGELLPALERGDIDLVMSGWRVTPEREQKALFAEPYLMAGLMAVIRTDDVGRFHNPAALLRPGYRLAVTGEAAAYAREHLPAAELVPAIDADAGLQMLMDRKADVLLDDAATSWRLATDPRYGSLMSLGRRHSEEPLAWAVRKDNAALQSRLNNALRVIRQTGVLDHVYNRWIPMNSVAAD